MKNFLLALTVFLLLVASTVGIGWLSVVAVQAGIAWVLAQESQIAAAIIATFGPLFAGILAFLISQQRSRAREVAAAHRPMKAEFYSRFLIGTIETIHRLSHEDSPKDPKDDPKLVEWFQSTTTSMMLWGSSGVIKAWSGFREAAEKNENGLLKFDDLIKEIRKDLGHKDWLLPRGTLIKLMLSDPENVDSLLES